MSILQTLLNIKIPYATEGVIRTAQLDDTIAPIDSVQLAVNMNFDRVGAIQTRPGVTSYADDIAAVINNYGSLRNSVIPAGFDFIFQFNGNGEVSAATFSNPSAIKVSETKVAIFWRGESGDGYCRNFSIDQTTGTIAPIGLLVRFETDDNSYNKSIAVDADHVINVWRGTAGAAMAAGFNVSGDTIIAGTPFEFESVGWDFSLAKVDGTHVICFLAISTVGVGDDFEAQVLAINTTTLAITQPGATLTIAGTNVRGHSCARVDGTHFIDTWSDTSNVYAQVFLVNTGTWGISAVGSALSVAAGRDNNIIDTGDSLHFVDIFTDSGLLHGQTLAVNAGTFAVTTVGTALPGFIDASGGVSVAKYSSTKLALFYSNGSVGSVRMANIDGSYNLTYIGNIVTGYQLGSPRPSTLLGISSTEVLAMWGDTNLVTGQAAFFSPYGTPVNGQYLYAAAGPQVWNRTTGAWTSRRGIAQVSKPRFSQYLNYIWMVDGSAQIGGDPVATSKGGDFGTDLVPAGFPAGDFIQAGFEGRVWVANKTTGVIYYTDIVQFIQPSTYILTYNSSVNFISQLTPQTGQSFTALYRVPRALLVFTEDSIFRIYGATSVDAYPAYNVGTYSQESIIETKTGIFFHHSSGFYQFDYGSQPVEISRRIIDFVKAIPRANYDDITGVYDGFDCVEWAVGSVTVEGVVFSSCVLRYTISTQVWTVYDYVGNVITAMFFYDDGTSLNHLMGTYVGKTGTMDVGTTDFGSAFYYEFIDRWRSFTDMYYQTKSISGINVYSENASGANLSYQIQKSGPNAWKPLGTVTEANNAVKPNTDTDDFDVIRLRLAGNTKGAQVVVHGIEITQLTVKGQEEN